MDDGIGPVIMLQDKSLVHISMLYIASEIDTLSTCELMKAYNVSKLLIRDSSIGIEPLMKFDDRFLKKQRKRLNVSYESI
jgi:hypothetical protein